MHRGHTNGQQITTLVLFVEMGDKIITRVINLCMVGDTISNCLVRQNGLT